MKHLLQSGMVVGLLVFMAACTGQKIEQKSFGAPLIQEGKSAKNIPILMYHDIGDVPQDQKDNELRKDLEVSAKNFEMQLQWLKDNDYYTLSFSEAVRFAKGPAVIRGKPIVLSFDDGYDDAYEHAFPLLAQYGFTGAFAIITGKVGEKGYLTWDEIKIMHEAGMEFLSHTVSHLDLSSLGDAQLKRELEVSKQTLEQLLGISIEGFVYPAGKYDVRVIQAVENAGYLGARTTHYGMVTEHARPFELPTIRIHGDMRLDQFERLFTNSLKISPRSL